MPPPLGQSSRHQRAARPADRGPPGNTNRAVRRGLTARSRPSKHWQSHRGRRPTHRPVPSRRPCNPAWDAPSPPGHRSAQSGPEGTTENSGGWARSPIRGMEDAPGFRRSALLARENRDARFSDGAAFLAGVDDATGIRTDGTRPMSHRLAARQPMRLRAISVGNGLRPVP